MTHEAIINGNEIDSIDPVVRVIIDNGLHRYEFSPEQVSLIEIRAIATEAATAAETTKIGSVHEGAGLKGIAQTPYPSTD